MDTAFDDTDRQATDPPKLAWHAPKLTALGDLESFTFSQPTGCYSDGGGKFAGDCGTIS